MSDPTPRPQPRELPGMTPEQLRGNPTGTARLVAWLGGYTAAERALGIGRNSIRYAADPGYAARIAARNAVEPARPRSERAAKARNQWGRVVHYVPPTEVGRRSWCGREVLPTRKGAKACKACLRIACAWKPE